MGHRTNASQTGTAFAASNSWTWGYNARGEIATADSSIAAYDRAYQTDEIGNLRKTSNIVEYEGGALTRAHTWGLDLSGSLQGAGGVGGLLASKIDGTTYYPAYDGNGNVSEYLNASGTVVAHYEYDAYGNILNPLTGLAPSFNIRFSTKYMDRSTAFYYYGYRYYQPFIGRWLNRDPIGERGGLNQYGMVGNDAVNQLDIHGLQGWRRERVDGWPKDINPQINDAHEWHYTYISVSILFCGCCDLQDALDEITNKLQSFSEFNSSQSDATIRLSKDGTSAGFTPDTSSPSGAARAILSPLFGGISTTAGVTLSGPGNGYAQQATTNTWHPLIGKRRWGTYGMQYLDKLAEQRMGKCKGMKTDASVLIEEGPENVPSKKIPW